jgi:hypothetical protein
MSPFQNPNSSGPSARREAAQLTAELDALHRENERLRLRLVTAEAVCFAADSAIMAIQKHLVWSINMLSNPVPTAPSVVSRHDQETAAAAHPYRDARLAWLAAKRASDMEND